MRPRSPQCAHGRRHVVLAARRDRHRHPQLRTRIDRHDCRYHPDRGRRNRLERQGTLCTIEETYDLGYLGGAASPADGDLLPLFEEHSHHDHSNGFYALSDVEPGTYAVTASAAGYVSESMEVSVTAGMTTTQNFELAPA
ncbi:MAG TPA: carboxypeptidase-like regulatory domain-containing protein [Candidatus Dormibacteraeota bacterium]